MPERLIPVEKHQIKQQKEEGFSSAEAQWNSALHSSVNRTVGRAESGSDRSSPAEAEWLFFPLKEAGVEPLCPQMCPLIRKLRYRGAIKQFCLAKREVVILFVFDEMLSSNTRKWGFWWLKEPPLVLWDL